MGGRPKNPVSDAEQLRQLTREAHEAIQDLREATRQMRQEREATQVVRVEHVMFLEKTIRLAHAAAEESFNAAGNSWTGLLQSEVDRVQDYLGRLLGANNMSELAEVIIDDAAHKLAEQLIPELDGNRLKLRTRPEGQVYVTADPALAPPGSMIIDGR